MDADDELAALRARAYAADATGLTASERERLRALEEARRPIPPADPPARTMSSEPEPQSDPEPEPDAGADARAGTSAAPTSESASDAESSRPPVRRVPLVAAIVVAVAAAAVGGVVGAQLAARPDAAAPSPTPVLVDATPLAIADRPVADVDDSRDWALGMVPWDDPSSVTLLGGAEDVLVWWGTISDGAKTCIAVDAGDWGVPRCEDTDTVRADGITLEMRIVRTDGGASTSAPTPPEIADPGYTVVADPYHDRLFVWVE